MKDKFTEVQARGLISPLLKCDSGLKLVILLKILKSKHTQINPMSDDGTFAWQKH